MLDFQSKVMNVTLHECFHIQFSKFENIMEELCTLLPRKQALPANRPMVMGHGPSKNTEFHFLTVLSKYSLIIVSTFNKTSFVPLSLYEQGTSNPLLFLFSRRPVTTAVIFPPEYNAYRQLRN